MDGDLVVAGNACMALPEAERAKLATAARTLVDARGLIVRVTGAVGQSAGWGTIRVAKLGARVFGDGWETKVQSIAEAALWRAQDLATLGMGRGTSRARPIVSKLVATASGVAGGFFGLPGLAVDIPLSTLVIMRSVADIARAHGEDIASDAGKRACLEVMAFGRQSEPEDESEVGYWSTRALRAHAAIEVAIRQAAARFGMVLSEKLVVQAVPLAGAVAGGGLRTTRSPGSTSKWRGCISRCERSNARSGRSTRCGPASTISCKRPKPTGGFARLLAQSNRMWLSEPSPAGGRARSGGAWVVDVEGDDPGH